MSKRARTHSRKSSETRILIPVGTVVDRRKIAEFLSAVLTFRNPEVILFHIIEAPSRTTPMDAEAYRGEINAAEGRLRPLVEWLRQQDLAVSLRIGVARNVAEAIVTEANTGAYRFIFLMKRRAPKGWRRMFRKSVTERVIRDARSFVISSLAEI